MHVNATGVHRGNPGENVRAELRTSFAQPSVVARQRHRWSERLSDQTASLPLVDSSRRTFCSHSCLSAAAVALAALSSACGGSSGTDSTSPGGSGTAGSPLASATAAVNGRVVSVALEGSPLTTVGSAALVRTGLGNFLLARTGQETFAALSAACTHEGNLVTNFTGGQFVCTVHGSQFNVSGTVARGPATRALPTYPATLVNGVVSFTV